MAYFIHLLSALKIIRQQKSNATATAFVYPFFSLEITKKNVADEKYGSMGRY